MIDENLKKLKIQLPEAPNPVGAYVAFKKVNKLLFISGLMVRGAAGCAGLFALLGKICYNGKIHAYGFWFILGTIGFIAYAAGLFGEF